MSETPRETLLLETLTSVSDTLVDEFDIVDLLQTLVDRCAEIFDVDAAGILLANADGELELVASTSEGARLVELMQLAVVAGPCIECFSTGQPVSVPDISETPERWAVFREAALAEGYGSLLGIPLRLRNDVIGALNLMRSSTGPLNPPDVRAATALANVATISIIQERGVRDAIVVSEQLQIALNSRIVIEQAKGVLSHTHGIPVDEAFASLRAYARANRRKLADVAEDVVHLRVVI